MGGRFGVPGWLDWRLGRPLMRPENSRRADNAGAPAGGGGAACR